MLPALIIATLGGQPDAVKKALAAGNRVDVADRGGATALHYAASNGFRDIVELLVGHGADVNAKDNGGRTPLHAAAQQWHVEIVRFLLDGGGDIDAQDNNGNTPLSNAIYHGGGRVDLIKLLVSRGADANLKNKYGVAPAALAEAIGGVHVAKVLTDGVCGFERSAPCDERASVERGGEGLPLVEYPGNGYSSVLDALTSGMKMLDEMNRGVNWVTFCGQGRGPAEDTYDTLRIRYSDRAFYLNHDDVDIQAILDCAQMDSSKVFVDVQPDGRISLPRSSAQERARFLDAVFRRYFHIALGEEGGDYALGLEYSPS